MNIASPFRNNVDDFLPERKRLGSVPTQAKKRADHLSDQAATAQNVKRTAIDAGELDREDVKLAQRNRLNVGASLAGHNIDPNGPEAAEFHALRDAEDRAKARHVKNSKERERVVALCDLRIGTDAEVRQLLARHSPQGLVEVDTPVDPGDDILAAIEERTITLGGAKARHVKVKGAGPLMDEVLPVLMRELNTLAAEGEVGVSGLYGARRRPRIEWPTIALDAAPSFEGAGNRPRVINTAAIAARYFRDEIEADIRAALAAEYADLEPDDVMSAAAKHTLLAELDAEIDLLERELAELIWLAREAGHDVDFPANLPAAAILGVQA